MGQLLVKPVVRTPAQQRAYKKAVDDRVAKAQKIEADRLALLPVPKVCKYTAAETVERWQSALSSITDTSDTDTEYTLEEVLYFYSVGTATMKDVERVAEGVRQQAIAGVLRGEADTRYIQYLKNQPHTVPTLDLPANDVVHYSLIHSGQKAGNKF